MPLKHSTSKKAVRQNYLAEVSAGKPRDQAYAIAKNVQRKAAHKKRSNRGY